VNGVKYWRCGSEVLLAPGVFLTNIGENLKTDDEEYEKKRKFCQGKENLDEDRRRISIL
jgi:hypothetical protein